MLKVIGKEFGSHTLNIDILHVRFVKFLRRNSLDIDLQRQIGT